MDADFPSEPVSLDSGFWAFKAAAVTAVGSEGFPENGRPGVAACFVQDKSEGSEEEKAADVDAVSGMEVDDEGGGWVVEIAGCGGRDWKAEAAEVTGEEAAAVAGGMFGGCEVGEPGGGGWGSTGGPPSVPGFGFGGEWRGRIGRSGSNLRAYCWGKRICDQL